MSAAGSFYASNIGNDLYDCLSPATACATINGVIVNANPEENPFTRDRVSSSLPDQRYYTLNIMQEPVTPHAFWEIAGPAGACSVHLVAGDPDHIDRVYEIMVEDIQAIAGTPTSQACWFEATLTVEVTSGFLAGATRRGQWTTKSIPSRSSHSNSSPK